MTKITESDVELLAIERLEAHGYQYLYGPDIGPNSDQQERASFEEVLLVNRLENSYSKN